MSDLLATTAAGAQAATEVGKASIPWFDMFGLSDAAYQNRKAMRMQQRNIEIARDREDNAIQRRVRDLTAAGLHPTLAAGGPAASASAGGGQVGMPSRQTMPGQSGDILQGALTVAQIKQTNAETERLRMETKKLDYDQDISEWDAQLRYYRELRDIDQFEFKRTMRELERNSVVLDNIQKSADISEKKARTLILDLDYAFQHETGYKPSSIPQLIQLFEYALARSGIEEHTGNLAEYLGNLVGKYLTTKPGDEPGTSKNLGVPQRDQKSALDIYARQLGLKYLLLGK